MLLSSYNVKITNLFQTFLFHECCEFSYNGRNTECEIKNKKRIKIPGQIIKGDKIFAEVTRQLTSGKECFVTLLKQNNSSTEKKKIVQNNNGV